MSRNNFHGTFGDYDDYNTFNLEKQKWSELRKEYRRLRKEAKQRIKELKNSEFADAKILQNKEYLDEPVSDMTKDELVRYTSYTAAFLASDLSTVAGQNERLESTVEKFHDLGYENINRENFQTFTQYMESLQPYIAAQVLGSDTAVDIYDTAVEKGISIKNLSRNINFYIKNNDAIKELDIHGTGKHQYTANSLREILSKRDMLNE